MATDPLRYDIAVEALKRILKMEEPHSRDIARHALERMGVVERAPRYIMHAPRAAPGELTARQDETLQAIKAFRAKHGYGPSVRELGDLIGIRSPNGVMVHIHQLRRKGYLTMTLNTARSFVPCTPGESHDG